MTLGHNSSDREQLRSFIERIERFEEEKGQIAIEIKDIYTEAKDVGFNPKIMREVVKLRAMDPDERALRKATLDLYLYALGMSVQQRIAHVEAETGQRDIESDAAIARDAGLTTAPDGRDDPDIPESLRREKAPS